MYGLIGYPLEHSFSAKFFNKKFEDEGINEYYELFPIPRISDLGNLIASQPELRGLNVTIPYKEQILPLLSEIDYEAREIGAVNVVKIDKDSKKLKGFNTDAIGFRRSIEPLLNEDMTKALILGTGGASKAVAYILKTLGKDITFVSRKSSSFAISYDELSEDIISDNLIIINTTPLGMWPDIKKAPAIPYEYLTPRHLCFDLIYNPEITEFMRLSAQRGARVKNGMEMLYGQALAAWEIWNS